MTARRAFADGPKLPARSVPRRLDEFAAFSRWSRTHDEDPASQPIVITVHGDLDISRYDRLVDALKSIPAGRMPVLIELLETDEVDAYSFAELLLFKRKMERQGRRAALLVKPEIHRRLANTHLVQTLSVFADREQALRALTA